MVLKKKNRYCFIPLYIPFPSFKSGRYIFGACKNGQLGQTTVWSSNKLRWLMSIDHEALVKAQQYKYYIHHMYRKLSNIRAHIDVYNVREWDHRFVKHG